VRPRLQGHLLQAPRPRRPRPCRHRRVRRSVT
jgi:hypothetical protein